MTRYEWIHGLTKEDMAKVLCEICGECSDCFVQEKCRIGHTGFLDWLDEEVYDDDER